MSAANSKVKSREIAGTPNVKLFTIAKFHETRLNKVEKFLASIEKFIINNSNSSERMDTLEENLSAAFDSIQGISQKVNEKLKCVDTLEGRMVRMATRSFVTNKLAGLGVELRLLAGKIEEIEKAAINHDHSSQEDNEKSSDEEEVEEGAVATE